jgi:hypothetical protein
MGYAAASSGVPTVTTEAYTDIADVVSVYCDALHTRDADKMRQVWHPSAHLKRIDDEGSVLDISAERFFDIVSMGEPTQDPAVVAQNALLSIDVLHPDVAAMAHVQITLPPKRYTDFLSLVKLNGRWMIINKMFTSVEMTSPTYLEEMSFMESHSEIADALTTYFYSLHLSDADLIEQVLHKSASVYTSVDGQLRERDNATFKKDLAERLPSSGTEVTKFDKIIAITKSGSRSAVAKVQIGFPHTGKLFTDHLSMLKVLGHWMIVNKTHTEVPLELGPQEEPKPI